MCSAKGTGGLEVPDFKLQADYKRKIGEFYDGRSGKYDNGDWHPMIAKKLIDGCSMQPGDRVLDLCAGTGISTFIAADAVGKEGRVVRCLSSHISQCACRLLRLTIECSEGKGAYMYHEICKCLL